VCVQLRAKACQFIGTSLKKDSNVLFLHVSHQLVQLLRIVSVWNSVTVENSQVNVSNVSISCSIVPPTSLGLPIQRLACGLCKVEVRAVRGGLVSEVRGGGVGLGSKSSLDHFYSKNVGSLNNNILNYFLHYLPCNNGKQYMLRFAPSQEFKGEITADIINQHL